MKTKLFLALAMLSAATLSTRAGIGVGISVNVPVPAPVVVAPAPPAAVVVYPDTYVWDGYENVGVVNGAYFYLGPDNVWLPMPSDRLVRFHGWEHDHADWQTHAIHNDRFRGDAHAQPVRHDVDTHRDATHPDVDHHDADRDHHDDH